MYFRSELMPEGPQDGTFWISFNDVLKYFDCIDICKVRFGWNEIRLNGILPPLASQEHLSCILLTVLEPTEVDFTLFQVTSGNFEFHCSLILLMHELRRFSFSKLTFRF